MTLFEIIRDNWQEVRWIPIMSCFVGTQWDTRTKLQGKKTTHQSILISKRIKNFAFMDRKCCSSHSGTIVAQTYELSYCAFVVKGASNL